MKKTTRANLMLLTTAFIWGIAFVAQGVAADVMEPLFFSGSRMALATIALFVVVTVLDARGRSTPWKRMPQADRRYIFKGGACCGAVLALGSFLQQLGLSMGTGVGKAGFISALYIVMVPITGIFVRRRIGWMRWIAVALSALGLYFLCMQSGDFSIAPGDAAIFFSALAYTGHILVVDHFGRRASDCFKLCLVQFGTTSLICLIASFLFETPSVSALWQCVIPVAYAGVLSGGMGYTLQTLAQRDAEPTVASLLMSMESVFAVLAGWVLLGDLLSARELLGCALMMGGIVLAQLRQ